MMPIRSENKARYPKDWTEISLGVRMIAIWMCEGSPDFPNCEAINGLSHPDTGSKVVLTVGHLDHQPENIDRSNLRAWCQRCHLNYDRNRHKAASARNRREKLATLELF